MAKHLLQSFPLYRFTTFPFNMYRVSYLKQLRPFDDCLNKYLTKKRGQGMENPIDDLPLFPFYTGPAL